MHGHGQISEFRNVLSHLLHGHVDSVILGSPCKIVREPTKLELRLGHSNLLADVVNHVRVKERLRIGKTHVLSGEVQHSAGDVTGVFPSREHPSNVVDRRIAVRIPKGLMHRRNIVVMVFAVAIVRKDLPTAF